MSTIQSIIGTPEEPNKSAAPEQHAKETPEIRLPVPEVPSVTTEAPKPKTPTEIINPETKPGDQEKPNIVDAQTSDLKSTEVPAGADNLTRAADQEEEDFREGVERERTSTIT
jgi:hypothetical protein